MLTTPIAEDVPMFLFGQLSMKDSSGNSRGRNLRPVIAIVCGHAGDTAGSTILQDKLRSYDKSQFLRSPVRIRGIARCFPGPSADELLYSYKE